MPYEVLMVSETHLESSRAGAVSNRMGKMGWNSYLSHAAPSGKSETGTTGGVAIFGRKSHLTTPLDGCALDSVSSGQHPESLRWVACILRLRGVSVLLVELYLVTGIGMVHTNLEILQQVRLLKDLVNLPCIIAADWNASPEELMGTGWLDRASLTLSIPDTTLPVMLGVGFWTTSRCRPAWYP